MRVSCGAILYSIHPKTGKPGIVLGKERGFWLPFKGGPENGESMKAAAERELREETFALVQCEVDPTCVFSSRNKKYYLGACFVDFNVIEKFNSIRREFDSFSGEEREMLAKYAEKTKMRFFTFEELFKSSRVHKISLATAEYFRKEILSAGEKLFPTQWCEKRML
jgi:8-oxo-dGTP pyrophosphatase MutT (NUDIX family)